MTTTVTTRFGDLRGSAQGGIRKFLGVPFAQPPFGANRFELPKPIEPWTGARDAFEFGPTAPQSPYPGEIGKLPGTTTIPGDDILTLNIWAPEGASGLPVMVWIHGGALERGTAAIPGYDGTTFARDGVVYVSINYRIGAEGFSVLDDAPLNLGLEDAAAALKWIAAEISALGGDPKQITVFGESDGGQLTAALFSRPDTAGLIARGIIESGPLDVGGRDEVGRATFALADALGTDPTKANFARNTPQQLLDERAKLAAAASVLKPNPMYALAVDEKSLPATPREGLVAASAPIVIGSNTDECRLWFTPG